MNRKLALKNLYNPLDCDRQKVHPIIFEVFSFFEKKSSQQTLSRYPSGKINLGDLENVAFGTSD